MSVALVGVLLGLAMLTSAPARADRLVPPSRIESPRGMALGTGAIASSAGTQAQADNPANLPVGGQYQIESFLAYDPTFHRFGVGGSVADSVTSRLAAGASVRTVLGDNDAGKNKGWEGRVGLGFPIIEQLSIGIAARYASFTVADTRSVPERAPVDGEPIDQTFRLKGFTMDAALTLRPVPGLAISGLAYNIVNRKSPLAPLMVGGSAAFSVQGLTLGADVLVDLNRHAYWDDGKMIAGGGLEYLAGGAVPLRVGFRHDTGRDQSAVTGGLGYVDARFGFMFSLRQTVSNGKETSLLFAAQFFIQ
ncbi:MAG: hypothetical protein ABW252_24235 [Polyangiales bacterium]